MFHCSLLFLGFVYSVTLQFSSKWSLGQGPMISQMFLIKVNTCNLHLQRYVDFTASCFVRLPYPSCLIYVPMRNYFIDKFLPIFSPHNHINSGWLTNGPYKVKLSLSSTFSLLVCNIYLCLKTFVLQPLWSSHCHDHICSFPSLILFMLVFL